MAAGVGALSQERTIRDHLAASGSRALSTVSPWEVIGSLPFLHRHTGALPGILAVLDITSAFVGILFCSMRVRKQAEV